MITGPDSRFVLSCVSKRQAAVSHSTPEAEIVALEHVLRIMLLPSTVLWDHLLKSRVATQLCEDNQACFQVCKTGLNPTMHHLERTHQCNVRWVHERYIAADFQLLKIDTHAQAADIFTKPFTDASYWTVVMSMVHIVDVKTYWNMQSSGGGGSMQFLFPRATLGRCQLMC